MKENDIGFYDSLSIHDGNVINTYIADRLFDKWVKGAYEATTSDIEFDMIMVKMSADDDIIAKYHEYWGLTPADKYWIGE